MKKFPETNKVIDVFFIVIHHSTWKLDSVYNLFNFDKRFNPTIVVCPYTSMKKNNRMFIDLEKAYQHFKVKNYNVINSYNKGEWVDINKLSSNKIVFFTNPHNITEDVYQWKHFPDTIKYYVPYHHQIDGGQWDWQWGSQFHLEMYKLFYIDKYHLKTAKKIMKNKGDNVVITGYPAVEKLYSEEYQPQSVWKPQSTTKKKVIYAPHHTITFAKETGLSEFLNIAERMVDIAVKYSSSIQFAFKPHPILRDKLYTHPEWGVERTEEYYKFWENTENTQLEESDYIDLFLGSDALIHDSGSFLAEYLYVKKPVMYLTNHTTLNRFNDYGLECLTHCYTDEKNDVDAFLRKVINNIDPLKNKRAHFVDERLIPDKSLPSQMIFKYVCNDIGLTNCSEV